MFSLKFDPDRKSKVKDKAYTREMIEENRRMRPFYKDRAALDVPRTVIIEKHGQKEERQALRKRIFTLFPK